MRIPAAVPLASASAVVLAAILTSQLLEAEAVAAAAGGRDAEYYLSRWSSRSSSSDRFLSPVVPRPQVPSPPSPPVAVPPGTPHRAFLENGANDVERRSEGAAPKEGGARDSRCKSESASAKLPSRSPPGRAKRVRGLRHARVCVCLCKCICICLCMCRYILACIS